MSPTTARRPLSTLSTGNPRVGTTSASGVSSRLVGTPSQVPRASSATDGGAPPAPEAQSLTAAQRRCVGPLLYGWSTVRIARHLRMSSEGVMSQLKGVRRALGLSGTTRRVLVHSLLERGYVAPPACERPAPGFTSDDLALLSALAQHPRYDCIAEAAGIPVKNLRAEIGALVAKTGADNAIHLVSLAHRWQLLGINTPASNRHHGAAAHPPGGSP
ncbi:hypothetical protein GA0115261_1001811 [Streptomyces sp. OspMP-M43]|nr:hypothetical protein GA0115261_1001811 [Streptomyces sp. OspMP-M43]